MAPKFEFPPPPNVQAELPLYSTIPPAWDASSVMELAARLGVRGNVTDAGAWYVVKDGVSTLEVFQASHSLRIERDAFDAEGRGNLTGTLNRERAHAVADQFLGLLGMISAQSEINSIDELAVLVEHREKRVPERRVAGLQFSYRFALDKLPLIGPGAKAQVTVGRDGEIGQAYRFWREVKRSGTRNAVTPDKAFDRFAASALFTTLPKTARVTVTTAELGLLCLPPSETQGVLVPAYVLRGEVTTETLPNAPFVHYVAAADLDEVDAKRHHWSLARPSLLVA
jgi:hypothetical protein